MVAGRGVGEGVAVGPGVGVTASFIAAVALALDRPAIIDTLTLGQADIGGALLALAINWLTFLPLLSPVTIERFVAIAMMLLAMLKLQDVDRFATMFLNYDLLARRLPPYGLAYPFLEMGAGVLMLTRSFDWLSIPVALFIGGVGAVSVFKAVYLDKRELKCACVGGGSNVPLGFVSLTENLMMIAMALWMLAGIH